MRSSLLLVLLLAACALAMPADNLEAEASGLGPEEAEDEASVGVESDPSNMATADAAFASNFGSNVQGGVSTSFSATASVGILGAAMAAVYQTFNFG